MRKVAKGFEGQILRCRGTNNQSFDKLLHCVVPFIINVSHGRLMSVRLREWFSFYSRMTDLMSVNALARTLRCNIILPLRYKIALLILDYVRYVLYTYTLISTYMYVLSIEVHKGYRIGKSRLCFVR